MTRTGRLLHLTLFAFALLAVASPARAGEVDRVLTRDGEEWHGTIRKESVSGLDLMVEGESKPRRFLLQQIQQVIHRQEPALYKSGLAALAASDYKAAIRQLLDVRGNRDGGDWLYEYATFRAAEAYQLWGQESESQPRLDRARELLLEILIQNHRTVFLPQVQQRLAELGLDAAVLPGGADRRQRLREAGRLFTVLRSNAVGGSHPYNKTDPKKRWEIRARAGLLAVADLKETGAWEDLSEQAEALQAEAESVGLLEEAAEAFRLRQRFRLIHGERADLNGLSEVQGLLTARVQSLAAAPPTERRDRILCRLHRLSATLHNQAAEQDEANQATHRKKALLSHLRIAILYRNSRFARSEVATATIASVRLLVTAGQREPARVLLIRMKERFSETAAWTKEGKQILETLEKENQP